MNQITEILDSADRGDPDATSQLLPLVYDELRQLAAQKLAHEAPGQTLQPTALVHEAYLRLAGGEERSWDSRGHFFAAAAEAMRRILVDNARHKRSQKRGGDLRRVELEDVQPAAQERSVDLLALDEALAKLAGQDPQKAELVKLRYFGGLTLNEAAKVLGISPATADRHWAVAKAWLHLEMKS